MKERICGILFLILCAGVNGLPELEAQALLEIKNTFGLTWPTSEDCFDHLEIILCETIGIEKHVIEM